jgi:hypothetical membrane protein
MGLLLIIGTYFSHRAFGYTLLTGTLALTGIGAMGVGIFTEDYLIIHLIMSFVTFIFSGLSAIFAVVCSHVHEFKLVKIPLSAISIILGLTTLGMLVFSATGIYLGSGAGGIERMVVYPALMWGAGFGGYLMAHPDKPTTQKTQ